MEHRRLLGPLAAASLLLAAAGPASAATVSIRIEGQSATLVPRTVVTTPSGSVPGNPSCAGETLAGAIDAATSGDWDKALPAGFSNTILKETHAFANNDYWAGWVNNRYGNGFCQQPVQDGDELVVLVDTTDNATFASAIFPLELGRLGEVVPRGQPVTVTATEYRNYVGAPGSGTPGVGDAQPSAGVLVSGGGASATTDAGGRATVTFTQAGTVTVSAVKTVGGPNGSTFAMRAVPRSICVDDGAGSCGGSPPTTPPTTPPTFPPTAPPTETPTPVGPSGPETGGAGAAVGAPVLAVPPPYRAPDPEIRGIARRKRYSARKAPRELRGRVNLGSAALEQVRLRLVRRTGEGCQYFSGSVEAFRRTRCDRGYFFRVGDRAEWSYLLPERLGPGRYLLEVLVTDRTERKRREGVVFLVEREAKR